MNHWLKPLFPSQQSCFLETYKYHKLQGPMGVAQRPKYIINIGDQKSVLHTLDATGWSKAGNSFLMSPVQVGFSYEKTKYTSKDKWCFSPCVMMYTKLFSKRGMPVQFSVCSFLKLLISTLHSVSHIIISVCLFVCLVYLDSH